ncbi:MAG: ABC transporter ATP-binding protein [Hyphomicrobiales bacterium]|nr:MAG: ABC transporter ATP-binding protein [Hyphomicrobiales bacterium]
MPANRSRARQFFKTACQFWTGVTGVRAWIQTAAVLACVGAQISVAVWINNWNRQFFDALETRNPSAIWEVVVWLPGLVAVAAIVLSALVVSRMALQIRWRQFLTTTLVGRWVSDQHYYHLQNSAPDLPAPEYRIAEDGRLAIEPLVEFVIGLVTAVVSALTFATILWRVAGSANFRIGTIEVEIPSYMALAAIAYAGMTSYAAYVAGWPLVKRIAGKNEAEARFRADMTRMRENAESIALIRGDADERLSLMHGYGRVVSKWFALMRQQGIVALVLNANSAFFPIVPLLLIAPKYVSGAVTLGAVMQVVAAFMAVQAALIWFVDNFLRLAEWFASVERVDELQEALDQFNHGIAIDPGQTIKFGASADDGIHIQRLSLRHAGGASVLARTSLSIKKGERVLIGGESGVGKSTLIRALAGLWPWGGGTIDFPLNQSVAFVPQKPYLPLGSLRSVLLYPHATRSPSDERLIAVLQRCGLGDMAPRLGEVSPWDRELSGGERQRIAFARLLIQIPDIVIMDEATSALDEESQTSLLTLFDEALQHATLISVGHRASLDDFHDRKLIMTKAIGGATLQSVPLARGLA